MKLKALIPCLLIVTITFAQSPAQKLDSLFNSLYNYSQFNGNIGVAENGSTIYFKSYGLSDFATKQLNQEQSGFSLASVSKVFTSVAILQLKEKGKLKLEDFVSKYIPDFPYPSITIRHLLTHTSGLPDIDIFRQQVRDNPDKVFSNRDLVPALRTGNLPLEFQPGEKYQYTNSNYILLALLLERISKQTFQAYIQNNIFGPTGMTHTYFQKDSTNPENRNRVVDHDYPFLFSTELENVDSLPKHRVRMLNLSGFVGNGNIITTTGDMLKFDQELYSGKLVNQSSQHEAFTPNKLNNGQIVQTTFGGEKASYGLGWFILLDSSYGRIVGHTGGVPGALSLLLRNIDKKQTVVLFDNAFNKSLYKSGINAMNLLNNRPLQIAKQSLVKTYGSTLVNHGVDIAYVKFQELRDDASHYYVSEDEMNDLGLQLLYEPTFANHNQLALEVLKLNTLLFPNSFNTYDSYGEALAKVGKRKEAISMYRKSININPENDAGKKMLESLLKE
ncbi:serine hydrolase [Sediminibacterium roseum]|uniref:Serine hydrolase n=1 Tax=Sediminibacterium roseum TaxID=1978412 RepID=A0ABW9ZWC1_9BACT|nr:serine hydrolase domain-containing protein [Sediminibacterium roseum]NCI51309.1 serine hydrolase [Sediminibacterium roseum]